MSENESAVVAGIVLHNPEISRLLASINTILSQVDRLFLVDNGSSNISEIKQMLDAIGNYGKIQLVENGRNEGIAVALNQICSNGKTQSAQWVLTLDQDSVCPSNIIEEYSKYIDREEIGMICPTVLDENLHSAAVDDSRYYVDSCITSGSMIRLSAWESVGGFWNDLFIDMVDFDMCWSLKHAGYKILQIGSVGLSHEIGKGKMVKVKGKLVPDYSHNPVRDYYIVRNCILVGRKHKRKYQCSRWILRRFYLVNRYETERWKKNRMMCLGLVDGIFGNVGVYSHRI